MSVAAEHALEEAPLLRLEDANTFYGQIHILQDSNILIREGELVCLLGGNASGVDDAEDDPGARATTHWACPG